MGVNTLCQFDESGEIIAAVTAKAVLGIVLEAATSSTEPLVDILKEGDVIEAIGIGGTMSASEIGDHADHATGNEITFTDSSKDFLVVGWDGVTTTRVLLVPKLLAYGSSVVES